LALGLLHSCAISKYGLLHCWGGNTHDDTARAAVTKSEGIKVITAHKLSVRGIKFTGFKEGKGVVDIRDIKNVDKLINIDLISENYNVNMDNMMKV